MNIIVLNRETAIKEVRNLTAPAAVISISTVGDTAPMFNEHPGVMVFYTFFDDVDEGDKFYHPITDRQANDIADFARGLTDIDTLVVHCDAGVSRSAAVAAAIGKYFTGDDMFIFGRPRFTPNRTVYRKVLTALFERELSDDEKFDLKRKEYWNQKVWHHYFLTTKTEKEFLDIEEIPIDEELMPENLWAKPINKI